MEENFETKFFSRHKSPLAKSAEFSVRIKKYERAKSCHERRKLTCGKIKCGENPDAAENFELEADSDEYKTFKQQYTLPSEGRSPSESEQVLCQIVLPGDCGKDSVAFGGFVMKLIWITARGVQHGDIVEQM